MNADPYANFQALQEKLTPRETEVLAALVEGMTDHQIARKLGIEERTVRTHTSSIYSKLQVQSRTEAVLIVMNEQIRQAELATKELYTRIEAAQKEIEHVLYFMGRLLELTERLAVRPEETP